MAFHDASGALFAAATTSRSAPTYRRLDALLSTGTSYCLCGIREKATAEHPFPQEKPPVFSIPHHSLIQPLPEPRHADPTRGAATAAACPNAFF